TTPAVFGVRLSAPSAFTVTVNYGTANGTATAGVDYQAANGGLTFLPLVTSLPLTIQLVGDTLKEANETFLVNLSNASGGNATCAGGDCQGQGTIVNDDGATLSISDVSVTEGNSTAVNAVFTVAVKKLLAGTTAVSYA